MPKIADWLAIRRLRAEDARAFKRFQDAYEKIPSKDSPETAVVLDAYGKEHLRIGLAIQETKTRILLVQAQKYDVPIPPILFMGTESETWFRSPLDRHTTIMKEEARAEIRSQIRIEKRERWEEWYRWVPLLTGLTGLFGTLIGLIVALEKWV